MAIDVTVLGVSGTTVTIPFTSVSNAAAAQQALQGITNAVNGNLLTQVNYTGGSTLPAVSTSEGGVIATSTATGLAPFALGGQYVSGVVGSTGDQSVLVNFGTSNAIIASGAGGSTIGGGTPTVVSGPGGAEVGNLGTNTKVFFGGAAIQDFAELGLPGFTAPTATVWVTTPVRGTANFDDSSGSTTINLDTVAAVGAAHPFGQTLIINNNGNGQTTVNVSSNTGGGAVDGDAMSFRGSSTVPTTVNAAGNATTGAGGVSLWALLKSGNAFINGGASNVIVFPTGAGVSATLFGGAGSDIDVGAPGLIKGGTAGGNILFGGTATGTTTLIGGGSGDVLVQQGAGNVMTAAAGNVNMYALPGAGHNTISGFLGNATPEAGVTAFMQGFNGGDTYITGNAAPGSVGGGTQIFATDDTNGGNVFKEGTQNFGVGNDANAATITGFTSGIDSVSLANPAGGNYTLVGSGPLTSGQVDFTTAGGNSTVNFSDGTTWTLMGVTLQNSDFH